MIIIGGKLKTKLIKKVTIIYRRAKRDNSPAKRDNSPAKRDNSPAKRGIQQVLLAEIAQW